MNIAMAVIGIAIAAFEFYTYSVNRRQYFRLLFELDDMGRPMINSMSLSTIHSKNSSSAITPQQYASHPMGPASRTSSTRNIIPQIVNQSTYSSQERGSYAKTPIYEKPNMSMSSK